jgi:hypothetical protein
MRLDPSRRLCAFGGPSFLSGLPSSGLLPDRLNRSLNWPSTHSTFVHLALASPPLRCTAALTMARRTPHTRAGFWFGGHASVFSATPLSSHQWKATALPNTTRSLLASQRSTTASCPASITQSHVSLRHSWETCQFRATGMLRPPFPCLKQRGRRKRW